MRKDGSTLAGPQKAIQRLTGGAIKRPREDSWAAIGCDTSMSSISLVAIGYDAVLKKHLPASFA